MPIPIVAGYSRKSVQANINALTRGGHDRNTAIRLAFNAARESFFKRNRQGALPAWLAYPKDRRTIQYYLPGGQPVRDEQRGNNPVRELDIDDDERDDIADSVQKQLRGKGADVRKAAALYTEFTGHEDVELTKIKIPGIPSTMLAIGHVDGVLYSTVRDNTAEKYIHKFKSSSRPLLAASPDGKQLYLIGGSYDFTDRGIVDS